MNKNKKGFTLIELLAVIVLLGVLMTIGVISMNKYLNQTKNTSYQDFELSLKSSATNYLLEHTGEIPAEEGTPFQIQASELIEKGYLKTLKDPTSSGTCNDKSYVIVKRGKDVSFNMDLEYHPCLKCRLYKTNDSVCSWDE